MRFHTDPTDTITVEENVHDYGDRSVRAQINDDAASGIRLYQSGDFASETVHLHLNEPEQRAIEVRVSTHEAHYLDDKPWATLTLGGRYKNDKGLRGHRESTVFLSAENLVEIRDELTKQIRRARTAGHIS
jgi:hypothetical protein